MKRRSFIAAAAAAIGLPVAAKASSREESPKPTPASEDPENIWRQEGKGLIKLQFRDDIYIWFSRTTWTKGGRIYSHAIAWESREQYEHCKADLIAQLERKHGIQITESKKITTL